MFSALRRSPTTCRGIAIDVGANDGRWSRWLRRLAGVAAPAHRPLDVLMLDPQRRVASHLRHIASRYNLTFLPVAAHTVETNLTFYERNASQQSSLLVRKDMPVLQTASTISHQGKGSRGYSVRAVDFAAFLNGLLRGERHGSGCVLAMVKIDVEGAEVALLSHLLTSGALCHLSHLLVEWHLNYLPPETRLSALSFRHALNATLHAGCARPPTLVHDEFPPNNAGEVVPGLLHVARLHNLIVNGTRAPYAEYRRKWTARYGPRRRKRVRQPMDLWQYLELPAGSTMVDAARAERS